MHRHLTLTEHGQFLGVRGQCLLVRDDDREFEYPLSRLKSVQIAKKGVSISSDALLKCASRGIKLFVCDFRNQTVATLSGTSQHAVVAVRRAQFRALESDQRIALAARLIRGKIRNQRATLLYFGKYHKDKSGHLQPVGEHLSRLATQARGLENNRHPQWRERLMGVEGQAAALYWQCLRDSGLLPAGFPGRTGRHALDATNMALNYGYAILTSYVWNAIINAGLEPYAGFFHAQRPGKPALVLDLMEEYRPWVVDRAVIKLRARLQGQTRIDAKLRKSLIGDIHQTFASRFPYRGRKLYLESILQRQVYRLAGAFSEGRHYRPYLFKW
ncbi:MAG TPA: CRISPR-associated endonuclease Cas1 [Chromatiaceae bacterium]|nr:CRISPR-associated endonuclease Cas1 [Chromatiaceae bacterium]